MIVNVCCSYSNLVSETWVSGDALSRVDVCNFFSRKNVNYKNFVFIGRRFRSINKMQLASV